MLNIVVIGIAAAVAGYLAFSKRLSESVRVLIRRFEPIETEGHGLVQNIAFSSRTVLTDADFISVTDYLQLLAAYGSRPRAISAIDIRPTRSIWPDLGADVTAIVQMTAPIDRHPPVPDFRRSETLLSSTSVPRRGSIAAS